MQSISTDRVEYTKALVTRERDMYVYIGGAVPQIWSFTRDVGTSCEKKPAFTQWNTAAVWEHADVPGSSLPSSQSQ